MKISFCRLFRALFVCAVSLPLVSHGAVQFSDDFETDTSKNWDIFEGSGDGTSDYKVDWAFVYTNVTYVSKGITNRIPLAPNSPTGSSKGVRLEVNKLDDVAATAAVNIYPKGKTFSGNYALRFDMWVNYNGGAFGGTGSTEFAIFGINHAGTQVNWAPAADAPLLSSDGVWFGVTGEGGANGDYRTYAGVSGTSPTRLLGSDGGFLDRNGDGTTEFESVNTLAADHPLALMFPSSTYETLGVPGKRWVEVEVRQVDGIVTWKINGYVIAQLSNPAEASVGTIMLGTMDVFSSIASPKADNFVLFDNVRVEDVTAAQLPSVVGITAEDAEAAEPGTNQGSVVLTRAGSTVSALTVSLGISGTAQNGVDYKLIATNLTFAAGESTLKVPVAPVDDLRGETPESVQLTLLGSRNYEVTSNLSARVSIDDDGDITAVRITARDGNLFERSAQDSAALLLTREGILTSDLVVKLTLGGTATAGSDYDASGIPTTVIIPAGTNQVVLSATALDDTSIEGTETIVIGIGADASYRIDVPATAEVLIRDDEEAPAEVLYRDSFESDSSAQWVTRFNAANGIEDFIAAFAYDYSADNIPAAPHSAGTTKGLKVTVNKNDAAASASAINVFPKSPALSGNFAVRADMYLNYSSAVGGTTEHAMIGINHSGNLTNRHALAGGDGVWFAIESDGSSSGGGRSYTAYFMTNSTAAPSFVARAATGFTSVFNAPPFKAAGAPSGQWVDVEVSQVGNLVSLNINGANMVTITNNSPSVSGSLMLGHMDTFNSIGSVENYTIWDNVRVVRLADSQPSGPIQITSVSIANGSLTADFSATSPTGLKVETTDRVGGSWAVATDATLSPAAAGFRVSLPIKAGASQLLMRIRRD